MADDWCILRTSGKSTLNLARTLEEDAFKVWTPVLMQMMRVPRMNVKREIKLPLLPSFVFASSSHLHELLALERMPVKPRRGAGLLQPAHRPFTLFRFLDRIAMIADRDLEPLRLKEIEALPKRAKPRFDQHAQVRVTKGAFEGLKGRVERCKSGYALVIFTDWNTPVQIPTFLLREDTSSSAAS